MSSVKQNHAKCSAINNMKDKMDMLSEMTSVENKKKTEICKKKHNLLPLLDSRG